MQAGRLRHRITIQEATITQDTYGQGSASWSDVATVWGSLEELSGREYMSAKMAQADVTTRITLRYRAGLSPDNTRLVWTDPAGTEHTYDVRDVIHDPTYKRHIQIMAVESLNA